MGKKRNRLFLSTTLMMLCLVATAQTDSSPEEKELLRLTNLLRTNPQLFLQKYARPYLIDYPEDTLKNKYISSLLSQLQSLPPSDPLSPDPELNKLARTLAVDMGRTGRTEPDSEELGDFDERMKDYRSPYVGENCSLGHDEAIDILMQMLMDEGDESLTQRKNLINPDYKSVGIAIRFHIEFEWNCVMDFSN